jgi:DNA-binding HxlR family transcriptional regulator
VTTRRTYNQNCPIARGLDIIGERWTLLILRELVGGVRRYSDLRAELPGIATNLLANRLNELQQAGLVDRTDLPAPIGRTVYSLSDLGWQQILPILASIARFGVAQLDPVEAGPVSQLNGFLAGILLGFNPAGAVDLDATYRVEIDGRRFEFAITGGRLGNAHSEPTVTIAATAADLVTIRLGPNEAKRRAALRRINFDGNQTAVDATREVFSLSEKPS